MDNGQRHRCGKAIPAYDLITADRGVRQDSLSGVYIGIHGPGQGDIFLRGLRLFQTGADGHCLGDRFGLGGARDVNVLPIDAQSDVPVAGGQARGFGWFHFIQPLKMYLRARAVPCISIENHRNAFVCQKQHS